MNRWLVVPLVIGLTGCPREKPAVEPPSAPVVVRVSAPEGPAVRLIERYGKAWARTRNLTLTLVPPGEAADLLLFAPAEMGRLAPQLRPLSFELTQGPNWNGLVRLYRTRLLDWGGRKLALPVLGSSRLLAYRADLFRDAAIEPPRDWDEFVKTAGRFPQPSLPPLPADEAGLERVFLEIAAPLVVQGVTEDLLRRSHAHEIDGRTLFAFLFDPETAEPRLNHPGFARALAVLQQTVPMRATTADALTAGSAVMGVIDLLELASLNARSTPGRWGVAPVPGGPGGNFVPYVGGGVLGAVAAEAREPAAAEALLVHLSSPALSLDVLHDPSFGGGPFRDEHLVTRREGWFNYGLTQDQTNRLTEILRAYSDPPVVNAVIPLRTPDAADYRTPLVQAIRFGLSDDPAAALSRAEAAWREILERRPVPQRRADFRRSLGLQ